MNPITATFIKAFSEPTRCTLRQLISEYGLPENEPLSASMKVDEFISEFGLVISPPIGIGDIDDERYLKRVESDQKAYERISDLIAGGEKASVEFKTTIFTDSKKYKFNSGIPYSDCYSDAIHRKAAAEIAAFANGKGGTIIFGVEDDGNIYGIDDELNLITKGGSITDKADHCLKQLFEKYFLQGMAVMSSVKSVLTFHNGKTVLSLDIPAWPRLVFLKEGGEQLYIRIGTNAVPIKIHELENYFSIEPL